MITRSVTAKIIGCAISVHKEIGPGLICDTYKECLYRELLKAGLSVIKDAPMPVTFHDDKIDKKATVDFLVEDLVIVLVKSAGTINELHVSQTFNYLKHINKPVGLIINFNVVKLKDGIKRVYNNSYIVE